MELVVSDLRDIAFLDSESVLFSFALEMIFVFGFCKCIVRQGLCG